MVDVGRVIGDRDAVCQKLRLDCRIVCGGPESLMELCMVMCISRTCSAFVWVMFMGGGGGGDLESSGVG